MTLLPDSVGLPPQTFLYTLDQIAGMINISQHTLEATYVFFMARSLGRKRPDEMRAYNIAPEDKQPDWRIPQQEFIRWLRLKKIRAQATVVID